METMIMLMHSVHDTQSLSVTARQSPVKKAVSPLSVAVTNQCCCKFNICLALLSTPLATCPCEICRAQ